MPGMDVGLLRGMATTDACAAFPAVSGCDRLALSIPRLSIANLGWEAFWSAWLHLLQGAITTACDLNRYG